ncbi:MAG: 2,6-dihydroxypyridine 3-monooxygenase [Chroococcidiopsis sp. SAG 2025]|uniref:FAD binding domain-containing protein n=1 Tax=Chroococcidiopsis sp. SAG 2025 TaxID=171389 RepID=UPI0029372503|nr:FAD binding domain-containing protein [Chroococcidiopsis sp. SAG 2025]MDV2994924.1 2,6-dihydroxypyridine 3-monooxygenase [Chroococcidiopsis sp. SAG 2025]
MNAINKRALVIGGSLAGLFAGTLLRSIGWQVDIYERSPHNLDSRGGGIVLQPDVVEAFQRAGIACEDPLGVVAHERYYLKRDGRIAQAMPMRQTLTSWNLLYGSMRRHFPADHYHQGKHLTEIQQDGLAVTAMFADGTRETGDLLVGADGPASTIRHLLLPDYTPQYAGYVAYRGLVDESELDPATAKLLTERFVFYQFPNSHILQYVIPGENESLIPGERRFNWVWYVNYNQTTELPDILTDKNGQRREYSIAPGMIHPTVEQAMRSYADRVLAPPFQKLVAATQEPFVQAILDLGVPQMAFERIALIGDAAFIPRPHTAASTAKAAANAIALVDALVDSNHDVPKTLKAWEGEQLALGMRLWKSGEALGERSQFIYGEGRTEG